MKRMSTIWASFRTLPLWVQIWAVLILVPINSGVLFFLDTPEGLIASILGIVGILPNLVVIWQQRGFSKMLAFPHLMPWTILVVWIVWTQLFMQISEPLRIFLWVLLIADAFSLVLDYRAAWHWLRGDREITRPN